MKELYVVVNKNSGKLLNGFKRVKMMYEKNIFINEPIFKYINEAKPLFFNSKEKAGKKMNDTMVSHWMYVRKAKEKELKKWGVLK